MARLILSLSLSLKRGSKQLNMIAFNDYSRYSLHIFSFSFSIRTSGSSPVDPGNVSVALVIESDFDG